MACFISKFKRFPGSLKSLKVLSSTRNYASALFMPGNQAAGTFAFFSPHLDFDRRFADLDKLKKDLDLRGFKIDSLEELKETWEFYKFVDANRWALEQRRKEITTRFNDLKEKKELTQEEEKEFVAIKAQAKVLKEDLKIIKEALYDIEDSVVVRALKMPNEIDDRTPKEVPVVLKIVGEVLNPPEKERKSHLEIGKNLGILGYVNPLQCYLYNEATDFELGALAFLADILGEDMIRIAGSDFSRSIVVEGSGLNHEDPTESFILADESEIEINRCRMHLVGGATMVSFLAMFTKKVINPNNSPLRYFATGRQYTPLPHETAPIGLFTVCQCSVAHVFSMVKDSGSEEYKVEFENLLQKTIKLYEKLGIHYRIVMRSASELRSWESLRVSFELWSAFNQQYVEVGFISGCGDFISKRLLIAYQTKNGRDFPGVISGTILSVPRLLACLLEQNPQNFVIPECIRKYMERKNIVN